MALTQPKAWLIAYDIADKRRLSRLHRFIKSRAVPVQYSVFYFEGSSAQVGRFLGEIETYINVKQDDVRAYPLPHDLKYDTCSGQVISDSSIDFLSVDSRSKALGDMLPSFECSLAAL